MLQSTHMPASTPFEALYQICSARNSCRRFSSELIPEEQIENILKLGYTAPFASGRKNWEILVVRDQETIARMVQTVSENVDRLSGQMNEDVAAVFRQYARNFYFFREAPVLFVPVYRTVPTFKALARDHFTPDLQLWERDNLVKSVSCVAMLILLAAQSQGLGSCYMTGPLMAQPDLADVLQLPKDRQIGALIPVGKPMP